MEDWPPVHDAVVRHRAVWNKRRPSPQQPRALRGESRDDFGKRHVEAVLCMPSLHAGYLRRQSLPVHRDALACTRYRQVADEHAVDGVEHAAIDRRRIACEAADGKLPDPCDRALQHDAEERFQLCRHLTSACLHSDDASGARALLWFRRALLLAAGAVEVEHRRDPRAVEVALLWVEFCVCGGQTAAGAGNFWLCCACVVDTQLLDGEDSDKKFSGTGHEPMGGECFARVSVYIHAVC